MVRLAMKVLPEPNPNSFGFGNQGWSLREVLDDGTSRRQSIAEIIKAKSGQPEQRGASHDGGSAKRPTAMFRWTKVRWTIQMA